MNLAETQCIHMVKINVLGGLQWKRIDEVRFGSGRDRFGSWSSFAFVMLGLFSTRYTHGLSLRAEAVLPVEHLYTSASCLERCLEEGAL